MERQIAPFDVATLTLTTFPCTDGYCQSSASTAYVSLAILCFLLCVCVRRVGGLSACSLHPTILHILFSSQVNHHSLPLTTQRPLPSLFPNTAVNYRHPPPPPPHPPPIFRTKSAAIARFLMHRRFIQLQKTAGEKEKKRRRQHRCLSFTRLKKNAFLKVNDNWFNSNSSNNLVFYAQSTIAVISGRINSNRNKTIFQ